MMRKTCFSSESVSCGHPDKICDQVADRILDELLAQDSQARVACEVTCATNQLHIFGEISSVAHVDYEAIARQVIEEIGYTVPDRGFDAATCEIQVDLHEQSPDIARGIRRSTEAEFLDSGAGDQGTVFGYACRETESLMPLPVELAHSLAKRLEYVRRTGEILYLLPDGKTQLSLDYLDGKPWRVSAVVVSAQHREGVPLEQLRREIKSHVATPVIPKEMIDKDTQFFINPTGRFVQGGPAADSGLSGRKLMVDSYGGYARHGGGSFSGKDASKVDRSGAYMARYIARNIVAQKLAERAEVQISYAIGLAEPLTLGIDCFGTETVDEEILRQAILCAVDLRPAAIIQKFQLTRPIYAKLSCYGHFGSNASAMPWEQDDLAIPCRSSTRFAAER